MSSWNISKSERDGTMIFTIHWRNYVLTVRANPYVWLALTALLSWLLFVLFMGWTLATVLMVSVFIHELGHAVVGSRVGLKNISIHFIPLLGACTTFSGNFNSSWSRAALALAGPAAGMISAWIALVLYWQTGWEPLLTYVAWTFLLTISNLAPMLPLDGGHVVIGLLAPARVWVVSVVQTVGLILGCSSLLVLGLPLGCVVLLLFAALALAHHELRKVDDVERISDGLAEHFELPPDDPFVVAEAVMTVDDEAVAMRIASGARMKRRRWLVWKPIFVTDDLWFESRGNLSVLLTAMFQKPMGVGLKVAAWSFYLLTVALTILLGVCALGLSSPIVEFASAAFMLDMV